MNQYNIAIFAALSAFGWISMFFAKKKINLFTGNCFGIVYHLSLAPVIATLPAPEFVKMAGYFWIFCDALIDVGSINKLAEDIVWALRMGVHIPASIWIVGASLGMSGLGNVVGCLLGVLLFMHAIFGPMIPKSKMVLFAFVFPLMTIWLGTIAITNS